MARLTFLGSGASFAVPSPGCKCPVCAQGFDPFAKWYRTRSSVLIENEGHTILVEVSPDFREQVLKNNVQHVDACLVSHGHIDAFAGIPDLRGYTNEKKISIFANVSTRRRIKKTFAYAFDSRIQTTTPKLELQELPSKLQLFGVKIATIPVLHPPEPTLGFRFNDTAFLPDIKALPLKSMKLLTGIQTLIIGATGREAYYGHQSVFESIALAKKLAPERTILTHLGHAIEKTALPLEKNMELAFDGLQIQI